MEQTPMPFMRSPQASAPRAKSGHEQPIEKPPQEPSLHREKWDKQPNPSLLKLRQVQDKLEREHGAMAITDPKEAEETFGEDIRTLEALVADIRAEPDNENLRAMLDEIYERRMPKVRKSA